MKLSDIIQNIEFENQIENLDLEISDIHFDSRKINKNSIFVAVRGVITDGHKYIKQAVDSGAIAVIAEEKIEGVDCEFIIVKDASYALGIAASNFYDNPSKSMNVIGVTGTNGKTTIVTLLFNLFKSLGYSVGLLSTVENRINDEVFIATHTTPDHLSLQSYMHKMKENACEYVFMEISSHALAQNRIAGLDIDCAIFTNLSHDHFDYHHDFAHYRDTKKLLFDNLKKSAKAIINIDDSNGVYMTQNTKADILTYSKKQLSDYKFKVLEKYFNSTEVVLNNVNFWTKLTGDYNAYNIVAVAAVADVFGLDKNTYLQHISGLDAVSGRFQCIYGPNKVVAIIDYAHTPDALLNVLSSIRDVRDQEKQRIICVVGAGGNRDKTKRSEMAQIASELSDVLILTSDNPRNEKPSDIISDMLKGVNPSRIKKVLNIENRREAIKTASVLAEDSDIILIAGKGSEQYQEIDSVKHFFYDKEEIKKIFNA